MRILINKNNEIVGYSIVGNLDGDIEVSDSIFPSTFRDEYKAGKFKYIDDTIIFNNDFYEEEKPSIETPINSAPTQDSKSIDQLKIMVSNLQKQSLQGTKLSMQMAQQNAKATQKIVELENEINKLKEDKGVE
ncbi:DUF2977 domain-containing protein [Staphylococcus caeli]|uniref:DUF2977 domain-containing protein n=1 Tax=Staphylococcus caeli TaxID=2201815 RepID=UPI003F557FDF